MAQFFLTWDKFKTSFCDGLSSLQQNGEFVDMTLAADGHLVKVHQLVLALASPYIKELISSANCPHPVIFLKSISYKTLCALLEYVYTGEVSVSEEKIDELLEAGRELRIKGLIDMKYQSDLSTGDAHTQDFIETIPNMNSNIEFIESHVDEGTVEDTHMGSDQEDVYLEEDDENEDSVYSAFKTNTESEISNNKQNKDDVTTNTTDSPSILYTVSNQGRLRMVLNRYMYYLKYSTRKSTTKQWRCVDYLNRIKCPAHLITKGNVVIKRIAMHTHPFHDKKILKKVQEKAVFSTEQEAQDCVNK